MCLQLQIRWGLYKRTLMESEFSGRLCSDKWQSIEKEGAGERGREGDGEREGEINSAREDGGQLHLPQKKTKKKTGLTCPNLQ